MSAEGMWGFLSGSAENPALMVDGGIIVLETGRLFGGDSVMAYVGEYKVEHGNRIVGTAKSWQWNVHYEGQVSVFGNPATEGNHVEFFGEFSGDMINGTLWPVMSPDLAVLFAMKKVADLP